MSKEVLKSYDIPYIEQAAQLLKNDISEPITISTLADKIGINSTKLKIGFKQLYNQTIYQFRLALRLAKVLQLLEETDLSVKQIAHKTGFDSRDSLSRCFRNKFHTSPRAYRNRQSLHLDQNVSMFLSCTAGPNLN